MRSDPTPELVAKKTISVPEEPAAVLGFTGRNRIAGKDVLILKRDMLPVNGPFVGIPHEQTEAVLEDRRDLFVVSDSRVIGVSAAEFNDLTAIHTFADWYGQQYSCRAFHGDDATVWSRDAVSIE